MRRNHSEVTDPKEIDRILNSVNIGRIATNGADGYPYITAVNFVWHKGNIYFHCAPEGQRLDNIEKDSRTCFEVDVPLAYLGTGFDPDGRICQLNQFFHSVIIRGEARVVPDGALKAEALNALVSKHEGSTDHEQVTEDMPACKACKVVEIKPVSMSCKSWLWQHKDPERRLAAARYLKARGLPGDLETVVALGFEPEEL
jgi:nitroimidazol reductase NimA-like FMN-containing flavoprotein (pyridoxamine 5'-phosphate oxidase superfamily)